MTGVSDFGDRNAGDKVPERRLGRAPLRGSQHKIGGLAEPRGVLDPAQFGLRGHVGLEQIVGGIALRAPETRLNMVSRALSAARNSAAEGPCDTR